MDSDRRRVYSWHTTIERFATLPDRWYDRMSGAQRRREMTMAPMARTLATTKRHDARSFAAYMVGRPAPLDQVERTLLRLDWLARRLLARA